MAKENEIGVSLELLTDDVILDYTTENENGGTFNHVLNDDRDINLKNNPPKPYLGGLYDPQIFGSPIAGRCLCNYVRRPSDKPCPVCGCRVYTTDEALRRFGRIELPFYYLNELRFQIFKEFFDTTFQDSKIVLKFANPDLKAGGYSSTKGSKKLGIKVFDSCQFDYKPKTKELVISEFITDESKCSYEGLIKIYEKYFPSDLPQLKKLINRYYLVQPSIMRPFTLQRDVRSKKTVSGQNKLCQWYSIILRFCCSDNANSKNENYETVINSLQTPGEKVRYTSLLRALLNVGKKESSELLNSSKENLARELYSVNNTNSARCPIIPSTKLAIDEVELPRHIVYEMCRSGFCKYLEETYGFDHREAVRSTKEEYNNPEIQEKFKEYAEQQVVINSHIVTLG